jgi:aryl-alcohol dehydrogenase-like predicted oxidoreductase
VIHLSRSRNPRLATMVTPQSAPRLGLGMAALGRPGYINLDRSSVLGAERTIEMMLSQANSVMDKLFACSSSSLPWIDCARSYGLSERFVGEYLRSKSIAPDEVYVSSKWGYSKLETTQQKHNHCGTGRTLTGIIIHASIRG